MQKATWIKATEEEIKKLIIELAKQGIQPAQIGLMLRDQHGIPKIAIKNKISQILKKEGLYTFPDLKNIETRAENLKVHFDKNKQDKKAKSALQIIEARKRKIKNYSERLAK